MTDQPPPLHLEPLRQRAAATPERTSLVDRTKWASEEDDRWTYRALDAAVEEVAVRLDDRLPDNPPSRRIGLAVSPGTPFVATLFAALRLGWTVAPLDPGLPDRELATRVDRLDPALVVCDRDAEASCLATDRPVASVGELYDGTVPRLLPRVIERTHHSAGGQHSVAIGGNESTSGGDRAALILFTSGTTGRPKAVQLTLSNLFASAVGSAFRLRVDPDGRWLGCLPVHHMGGLAPVFRSVWYGTTLVLSGSFDADGTREEIRSQSITGVSLVPTQLKRLLDAGWTPSEHLRSVLLGGAPAGESLLSRALDAGVPVCPTYGLTETASQVATARPADVREHPDIVGQPLLWTQVTILDDGEPVGSGERGEVVVDGPTVTPGYLDDDATAAAFGEYGLHTGDLGVVDADGRLRILGRIDDVINTGGELVAPTEVVAVLESHPRIAEATVVGLDDPEWGERVAALVVLADAEDSSDNPVNVETIREYSRGRLSDYKLPKTVVTTERLPRTDSGTIDREAAATEIERRKNRS